MEIIVRIIGFLFKIWLVLICVLLSTILYQELREIQVKDKKNGKIEIIEDDGGDWVYAKVKIRRSTIKRMERDKVLGTIGVK